MGEYRGKEWQGTATSVRDRMDFLYNNMDMSDLIILAADEQWWWGQTVKEFTAHRLVLCAASPVFHQLFYPAEGGPDIPPCLSLSQNNNNNNSVKVEIEGIPPIAVEAMLEYCYKDRFDKSDYENGYSRNLLWRLWHAAKVFRIKHLVQLCSEVLESTICDETVFWDLNYSLVYADLGTDIIRKRVKVRIEKQGNCMFEHPNLVWLDTTAIREILSCRAMGSSEPGIVLNNTLRWSLYQLDRTICEEEDGKKDAEIPLESRIRLIKQLKEGRIKEFTEEDVSKYLDRVLDLVPFSELSQKEFLLHVMDSGLLNQDKLVCLTKEIMSAVVENPERLYKSEYMIRYNPSCSESSPVSRDPCSILDSRSLDAYPPIQPWTNSNIKDTSGSGSKLNQFSEEAKTTSPLRARPSIKQSLEQARLRRTQENRKSFIGEYNEDRFEEKQKTRSEAKDETTLEANADLRTSRLLVEE